MNNKDNKPEWDEDLAGDVGSILADFEQSGNEVKAVKGIFDLISQAKQTTNKRCNEECEKRMFRQAETYEQRINELLSQLTNKDNILDKTDITQEELEELTDGKDNPMYKHKVIDLTNTKDE